MIPQQPDKTKVEYPRRWRFQVIGPVEESVRRAVAAHPDIKMVL